MSAAKKLTSGAVLTSIGGAGIIFEPLLGFSDLARPWSFILGFVFGALAGTGIALSLFWPHEKKQGEGNVHKK